MHTIELFIGDLWAHQPLICFRVHALGGNRLTRPRRFIRLICTSLRTAYPNRLMEHGATRQVYTQMLRPQVQITTVVLWGDNVLILMPSGADNAYRM